MPTEGAPPEGFQETGGSHSFRSSGVSLHPSEALGSGQGRGLPGHLGGSRPPHMRDGEGPRTPAGSGLVTAVPPTGPAVCQAEERKPETLGQEEGSPGGSGEGAGNGAPGPGDPSGLIFPKAVGGLASGGRLRVRTGRVPVGERGGARRGPRGRRAGHQREGGRPGGPPVPRALGEESRLHCPHGGCLPAVAAARWASATYAKGAAVGRCSAGMPPLPAAVMAYRLPRALTHPGDHRGALHACSL